MWFRRLNPLQAGLIVSVSVGLFVSAIASIRVPAGSPIKAESCQDHVERYEDGAWCQRGTYLELVGDKQSGYHIICHCSPPIIIQFTPQDEEPAPEPPSRDVLPPYQGFPESGHSITL